MSSSIIDLPSLLHHSVTKEVEGKILRYILLLFHCSSSIFNLHLFQLLGNFEILISRRHLVSVSLFSLLLWLLLAEKGHDEYLCTFAQGFEQDRAESAVEGDNGVAG